jgi:hypothetical protein
MAVTGTFGGFYFDPDVFTDYIQEVDPVHTSIIISGCSSAGSKQPCEQHHPEGQRRSAHE